MRTIAIFVLENIKKITGFLLVVLPVFFILLAFNTAHAVSPSSIWTEYDTGIYFNSSYAGMNTGGPGTNLYFSCPFQVTTYPYWNSDLNGSTLPAPQLYWHSNPGYAGSTNYLTDNYAGAFYAINIGIDCGSTITVSAYQSDIIPPTPAVSVSLYAPSSTIPDFTNWSVTWSGAVVPGTMSVYYGMSTSTMNYHDDISFAPGVSANPLPITKHNLLWFPPTAIPATWYAEAIDVGATSSFFSPIMTFSISPDASAPPTSTDTIIMSPFSGTGGGITSSTIANPTTNCAALFVSSSSFWSDPIGSIANGAENGICVALNFLFVPNYEQQSDLTASYGYLASSTAKKPPFGYFTSAKDALTSFQEGATTTQLISTSTYAAFSPIFDPLKAGVAVLIYFAFIFWAYHRMRNIEF